MEDKGWLFVAKLNIMYTSSTILVLPGRADLQLIINARCMTFIGVKFFIVPALCVYVHALYRFFFFFFKLPPH